MSSDATENTMRAEFEAWASKNEPEICLFRRYGAYGYASADAAWKAWQAARADTARQVAENAAIVATYEKLHTGKLGMHWLWVVVEKVAAGGDIDEALREFGYVQAATAEQGEAK